MMYLPVLALELDVGLLSTITSSRSVDVDVVFLCWSARQLFHSSPSRVPSEYSTHTCCQRCRDSPLDLPPSHSKARGQTSWLIGCCHLESGRPCQSWVLRGVIQTGTGVCAAPLVVFSGHSQARLPHLRLNRLKAIRNRERVEDGSSVGR